ncbi:DnaJ- protein scj1, partial [Linderina macrospora]
FFGGHVKFDRRGGAGGRAKPRGPDVHIHVPVSLLELYTGAEIDVDISKQAICPHCDGSGAASPDDIDTCSTCGGSGVRIIKQMLGPGIMQQMQTTCDECHGKGKKVTKECPHCKGTRVTRASDQLTVRVEPGMGDGEMVMFEEEADQHPDHEPGSVVFHLQQEPHAVYERRGDDLYAEETITLADALVGFSRTLQHVDNKSKVEIKRSAVTPPGFVQRLAGKGMPKRATGASKFGDLYVTYWVQFPAELDAASKDEVQRILGKESKVKWAPKKDGQRQAPQTHDEL